MPLTVALSVLSAYKYYIAGNYEAAISCCSDLLCSTFEPANRNLFSSIDKVILTLIQMASLQRQPLTKPENKLLGEVKEILNAASEYLSEEKMENRTEISVNMQQIDDELRKERLLVETAQREIKEGKKEGDSFEKWKDGMDGIAKILMEMHFIDRAAASGEVTADVAEKPDNTIQGSTDDKGLSNPTKPSSSLSLGETSRNKTIIATVNILDGSTVTEIPKQNEQAEGLAAYMVEIMANTDESCMKHEYDKETHGAQIEGVKHHESTTPSALNQTETNEL